MKEYEKQRIAWLQESFERVKSGDSHVPINDSRLLPLLANDDDCRRIVTDVIFTTAHVDPNDAKHVARLENVTSLGFYCSMGTESVLNAASSLPVTDIYFEMPDLVDEQYLLLKKYNALEKVRFEQVMDDELVETLKSELPDVEIDAPYLRSEEERLRRATPQSGGG